MNMNKKMIRTGIFSLAAVFTLATASSTVVSAHGNDDQQTMENREYGRHMQNHSSMWEEDGNQEEWRNTRHSMHRGEEGSWDREESETRDWTRENCHASRIDGANGNSRMMRSKNWSDDRIQSQHFGRGSVENNR